MKNEQDNTVTQEKPIEIIRRMITENRFTSQADIIEELKKAKHFYVQSSVSKLIKKAGYIYSREHGYTTFKQTNIEVIIDNLIEYTSPKVITGTKAKQLTVYIDKPLENAFADLLSYQYDNLVIGVFTGKKVVRFMFSNIQDMETFRDILDKKKKK